MNTIITDWESYLKYLDHWWKIIEDINIQTRWEYSKVMIKEIIAWHNTSCENPIIYKIKWI